MKRKILIPTIIFILAAVFLAFYFSPDRRFMRLADNYFDTFYFPDNPTAATAMGIHLYDDQLDEYSIAAIKKRIAALKKYEAQFEAVRTEHLSEMVKGDRELLLGSIRSQLLTLETIRPWEKNPDVYSSGIASSAFVIMSRKFAPANDRLRSLIAREKRMPAALTAARENLKNPPTIYTAIALEQLPGLIAFFRDDVPAAFAGADDVSLKREFAITNLAVINALYDYQSWLMAEVLPQSNGDFRIGAETFRKKLLFDEMVDTPLDQLVEIDLANMRQNQQEFIRVAKDISSSQSPQQVLAALKADHPSPDKLLEKFRGTFAGLVGFINDKHIITIPSEVQPIVEESPPFLRAITFASMDTPGPFEKVAKEAYFNVTLPDVRWDGKRIDEFMAGFSYPVINNISVHEAYPGHYIQFLWMHKVNDRVRKILGASSNAEGWAHYAEQMMLDEGLGYAITKNKRDADLLRLGQLQNALLRNARFIVGIKLHTGQMRFEEAVKFFEKEGFQSHAVALVETKRGTVDPTYLYYTLGKLEILKLRKDVQKEQGSSFDLQRFHNDFMLQGYPPIKIVRRAMLHNNSPVL